MLYIQILFSVYLKYNWWFVLIYLFHYLFNDFFILLANLIFDIVLVKEIRKNLKQKKALQLKSNSAQSEKILEEIATVEKNTIKLVVYPLLMYLLCRVPELVVYLLFLFNVYPKFCYNELCPLLLNVIQYLYVISYITNLFFYFKFYKVFRVSFKKSFSFLFKTN